jgi:hypothetical protein
LGKIAQLLVVVENLSFFESAVLNLPRYQGGHTLIRFGKFEETTVLMAKHVILTRK